MPLVNIDRQPDAVKRFFASLALTPEGSVVEMNGSPVARVLPAAAVPAAVGEWTPDLNRRRCELIDKKYDAGLTPAEEAELAALREGLRRFMDRVAPVPLDDMRRLHQQLLEKAAAAESTSDV
ncbi:MAG: hypothetical protein U0746_19675 [Gemmataceae bacterium]